MTQFEPIFGYTVIRLDLRFIAEEFLPRLIDKHFRHEAGDEYRIAVVSRRNPSQLIFGVNVDDLGALVATHDAEAEFFGFRPDQFQLVRTAAESMRGAMSPNGERRRSLFFSMTTRRPDPKDAKGAHASPRPPESSTRWRLLVRHRAGSLEAAVSAARDAKPRAQLRHPAADVRQRRRCSRSTAERAERLARQQMEFVAGVSHELRTPVSVIGAAAENLADGRRHGSRARQDSTARASSPRRAGSPRWSSASCSLRGSRRAVRYGHRAPWRRRASSPTRSPHARARSPRRVRRSKPTCRRMLPPVLANRRRSARASRT